MDEKVIVIGGGVGPLAGVKLHEHVITNTLTNGTDQDHIDVYHLSRSSDIQDRTEALFTGTPQIPAQGMFNTLRIADAALREAGRSGVAGVPCNTFHTPEIFTLFLELVEKAGLSIQILHMINETILFIKEHYIGIKKIGLMSTTGTRKTGIYTRILEPLGFDVVQVPDSLQPLLHDSIYNPEWGIKSSAGVTRRSRTNFLSFFRNLTDQGAEAVIAGCTEIPLALFEKEIAGVPIIDPMEVLARALVKNANPSKLKPVD